MIDENDRNLIEKITIVLQKIQDKIVPGTKGLDRTEVKDHMVFWELGLLLKEFVNSKSISLDDASEELENNFRKIEKKIRTEGKRNGKKPFPSWEYKNQSTKRMQEPDYTWILVCWDFVKEYQDLERWNLVAGISGGMFKEGFVRKRAEDLLPYFSKRIPPPNAEELQERFVKEISKFEKNPTRREFGSDSMSEGLIPEIFGKSKINLNLARKCFLRIQSDVHQAMDTETSSEKLRNELTQSIGTEQINDFRRLLRLISITDEQRFKKRLEQFDKIPKTVKTKYSEVKDLYQILYLLIKDAGSRRKFLYRVTSHDMVLLNTKLAGIVSDEAFREYHENQKSRRELFN